MTLIFFVALFTGIFVVGNFSSEIELANMPDRQLAKFLSGSSQWGCFFVALLYTVILEIIIIVCCYKRWSLAIAIMALVYKSYLLGTNIASMILIYGVSGTINVFLFIFPFDMLICIVMVVLVSLTIKKALIIHKYGCNKSNIYCEVNYNCAIIMLLISTVIILLIKTLLMPIIKITIIVS